MLVIQRIAKAIEWFEGRHRIVKHSIAWGSLFVVIFLVFYSAAGASVVKFYPELCLGDWSNSDRAAGRPTLNRDAEVKEFSSLNSALFEGGYRKIFCGSFKGDENTQERYFKRATLKFSWRLLKDKPLENVVTESELDTKLLDLSQDSSVTVIADTPASGSATITPTATVEDLVPSRSTEPEPIKTSKTPETESATPIEQPIEIPVASPTESSSAVPVVTVESTPTTTPNTEPNVGWVSRLLGLIGIQSDELVAGTPTESTPTTEPSVTASVGLNETTPVRPPVIPSESASPTDSLPLVSLEPTMIESPVLSLEVTTSQLPAITTSESFETDSLSLIAPTISPASSSTESQLSSVDALVADSADNEASRSVPFADSVSLDEFLEVQYSINGTDWYKLGSVTEKNFDEVEFSIPISSWENVHNLQVRLAGLGMSDTRAFIYLDSLTVEAAYTDTSEAPFIDPETLKDLPHEKVKGDVLFSGSKKSFRINEPLEFEIKLNNNQAPASAAFSPFVGQPELPASILNEEAVPSAVPIETIATPSETPVITPSESPIPEVSWFDNWFRKIGKPQEARAAGTAVLVAADILDRDNKISDIKPVISNNQGRAVVSVPTPGRSFRPGKYTLHVSLLQDNKVIESEYEFTWGVLAINADKSIYQLGDKAYLQMGSLNEAGHTLCQSSLRLEVQPPRGPKQILTTRNGDIVHGETCGRDNYTDQPDYYAYQGMDQAGDWQLTLINLDTGYTITDKLIVNDSVNLDVSRVGATRINPFLGRNYVMTIGVKVYKDFSGTVTETLPAGFKVPVSDDYQVKTNQIGEVEVTWRRSWQRGELVNLTYEYDALHISPEFFLLGPLKFIDDADPLTPFFQEARQWQLASDAACSSLATGTWSDGTKWSGCSGASGIPGSGDDVTITAGTAMQLDVIGTTSILSLTFAGGASAATLGHDSGANLRITSGGVTLNQPTGAVTNNWNIGTASASVTGTITFNESSTTASRVAKITLNGGTLNCTDITFNGTTTTVANKVIDNSGTVPTINVSGTISNSSRATSTVSATSIWNYNGSTAQTVAVTWGSTTSYANLNISNAAGATLGAALSATNLTQNLTVKNGGYLKNGGFAIVGAATKTFTMEANSTFDMTGSGVFPTGFTTYTMDTTSTQNFLQTGGTVIVSAHSFGNLNLKAGGTLSMTGQTGTITVKGNLTVGDGTNATTFTNSTNDPTINVTGNVTVNNGSTFLTANGTSTMSVGGNWSIGSTATYTGAATLTTTFNSTSTGKTIDSGADPFLGPLIFNGSGGEWSPSGTGLYASHSFTMTNGTLNSSAGTADVRVSGTNATLVRCGATCGTINLSAGTFYFKPNAAATFGTNVAVATDWTFNNLLFGVSAATGRTITISGTGTGKIYVNGNLTIGQGGATATVADATNDRIIDIAGNLIINSNGSFSAPNLIGRNLFIGGSFSNSGTFTHGNGTIVFDSTTTGNTIAVGASALGSASFNGVGGEWTMQTNNVTFANHCIVKNGSLKTSVNITGAASMTFRLDASTKFTMTGTAAFPVSFATFTFDPESTVIYNQTTALLTLTAKTYGHLKLWPSAGSVTWSFPTASTTAVSGSLTFGDGVQTSNAFGHASNTALLKVTRNVYIYTGATYDGSAGTVTTVGGSWYNNGGTYTPGSTTLTFHGSTTGTFSIDSGGSNFSSVTINGSGSSWSPSNKMFRVTGALTVTNGTFNNASGSANVHVKGDIVCGATCGTVNLTAGKFTHGVTANATFGPNIAGTNNWTFNDLEFSNNDITFGNPATISFGGLNSGTITVGGTFYVGSGNNQDHIGIDNSTANHILDLNGNFTTPFQSTFRAHFKYSSSAAMTIAGSYDATYAYINANNGTVTFDATSTGKYIVTSGSPLTSNLLYNVVFNGSGGGWEFYSMPLISSSIKMLNGTLSGSYGFKTLRVYCDSASTCGTINFSAGTVTLTGGGAGSISGSTAGVPINWTFYNLTHDTTGAGLIQIAWRGGTINVTNNLDNTYTSGTTSIVDFETYDPIINVDGNFSISNANTNVLASSTASFTVGGNWSQAVGTFTAGSGTVTFDSTDTSETGRSILTFSSPFYNVRFNGINGSWSAVTNTMNVSNDMYVSAGTLNNSAGSANIWVLGSVKCLTTCGTINLTTNKFVHTLMAAGATFGPDIAGSNAWTFKELTLRADSGTLSETLTINGTNTGTITVSGEFVISSSSDATAIVVDNNTNDRNWDINGNVFIYPQGTLQAGAPTFFRVAGNWTNTGVFTHNSGEVLFDGTGGTFTIFSGGSSFYDIRFNGDNTSTWTPSDNMVTEGSFTLQTSTSGGTFILQNGKTLTCSSCSGKSFSLQNDVTFQMLDTTVFPSGYNTYSMSTASTTDYNQDQATNIKAATYGILLARPSADSTTFTFEAGTTTVANTSSGLTIGNGANTGTVTAATNNSVLDVNGDVTIVAGATLIAHASNDFTVGRNWTNSGTFTNSGGTVTFDTAGGTINNNSQPFNNVIFNASATWSPLTSILYASGSLTMTAGTLDNSLGYASVSVNGGVTCSGTCGTISLTTGKFTQGVSANQSFGTQTGIAGWTFKDLEFRNKSGAGKTITTQSGGSGNITITGLLYVGRSIDTAATTLAAGNRTWVLSGSGTPFVLATSPAAVFNPNTSTVTYNGSSATTVTATNYSTLNTKPNAGSITMTIASGTLTVSSSWTMQGNSAGQNGTIIDANANNPILDINGNMSIGATNRSTTFKAPPSAAFTISGNITGSSCTFTHDSGTITFDGTTNSTVNICDAAVTFNNVTIATANKKMRFTAGDTVTVEGLLTITGSVGSPVYIGSTASGSQWFITHQGTESVDYAYVVDSGCTSSTSISTTNSVSGGNNGTCWVIGNGTLTFAIDSPATIDLGALTPGIGSRVTGTTRVYVDTDNTTGYSISVGRKRVTPAHTLASSTDPTSFFIDDTAGGIDVFDGLSSCQTGPNITAPWGTNSTGLGFTLWKSDISKSTTCWGTGTTVTDANNLYAALEASSAADVFLNATTNSPNPSFASIGWSLDADIMQRAGGYTGQVIFNVTTNP